MAGSDQSANLQGMLSQLAGTVGEMGAGRNFGANALRQIVRPDNQAMLRGQEYALDSSANLYQMAQWAERNGFDDKARQYMALAYKQKEKEVIEAKETRARMGSSANMYNRKRIAEIASDPSLSKDEKTTLINQAMEAQQAVAKATAISPTDWDSGTAALAAVNNQEKENLYNTKVNNIQNVIAQAEAKADAAPEAEKPAFEASLEKLYERLNNVSSQKEERLGDDMRDARRTRQREDAADRRAESQERRSENADDRAEDAADRDAIRLAYSIAASEAAAAETAAIAQAEQVAVALISKGKYEIPEEVAATMPAKAVIEARSLLETARSNAEAIETSKAEGTVPSATLERAKVLAETDQSIATLLKNYETDKAQAVHGGSSKNSATALTVAVVARDKATSEAGRDVQMSGAVGGAMQALLDQGSYSSWLDGFDDYAEVMADDDQFIQMRNAVSALAKEQGLTPDQITPDVLDGLMDKAAKGLSPEWRKAEQRRSRMRNKALTGWQRTLESDGMTYRNNVVKKYSGKTQWLDEELDEIAEEHYEEAINFYTRLIGMPAEEQQKLLFRSLVGNESIFKPKEIGASGSFMPPIMSIEEGQKLYDFVAQGNKLTINNFLPE